MVLDDNNFLKGAFDRPGLKRKAQERDRSSRRLSIASIILALVWLFGLASLFGIILAIMARVDAESSKNRRLADVALGLNLLGLFVAFALVVL